MDLLKFLLRLPLLMLRGIYWILSRIFGDFSWRAPRWMRATGAGMQRSGRSMRAHPGRSASLIAALLIVFGGGWFGYHWYRNLPRPIEEAPAKFAVQSPAVPDYIDTPIEIHPLTVTFNRSVAPLALVGKQVTTGIQLEPETAGTWTWMSDKVLTFQPRDDWAVGQGFDVRFDPKIAFAEH